MPIVPALHVDHVHHAYGQRVALKDLSLRVDPGQIFALLGPNGSGKSTLFRIISTLIPIQEGQILVNGFSVREQQAAVRRSIGVVFQNPALDKQLSIAENLTCHAHLYGISGIPLKRRIASLLQRFGLSDRAKERVHTLSGGLRRKVELAKALIPEPQLLLMDEPSTGLDVSARIELWKLLDEMRAKNGLTIILTTHLMDEADRCDRVAIIDAGQLLVCDTPANLKSRVGGDVITLTSDDPDNLIKTVSDSLQLQANRVGETIRIEQPNAHLLIPRLIEAVPGMINSISVGRPTLDDVFVQITGRRLTDSQMAVTS